jgi:arginyl-tRNA synthetase
MLNLIAELGRAASSALQAATDTPQAVPSELPVQAAARPEFGDLQISACLQLAKGLGKKPRDLAVLVQAALAQHPAVEKVEVAGPGYVNLFLRAAWLAGRVAALSADPDLGLRRAFAGQRVVIDFSSPNVAKSMHIGHIRSTIIGDCLQRVMRAVGYEVVADNHLGDWGTQFGKLIVAYRTWLNQAAYATSPISELERLYQKFVKEEEAQAEAMGLKKDKQARRPPGDAGEDDEPGADHGEEAAPAEQQVTPLLAAARAELARLQAGDEANLALWREFVSVSMAEFERSYRRLGVRFDVQLGESYYNPRLRSLVEELLERGIAEPSRGAVVCHVEGAPAPLLIRKGDGSFLYGTTDLATIEHRVKTWQPARILYVVGMPQSLHFQQVFAVARKMGFTCELEHIPFGSLRFWNAELGKWTTGSTRKGNVSLLEGFLDEAERRAAVVANEASKEKNPDLSEADLREIARVVGLGAVKYNDLSRDRVGDINFDLDTALKLTGNTAPYIQYAYARLRAIARKAEAAGVAPWAEAPVILGEEQKDDRALVRRLLDYPAAVEAVARAAKPHLLTEYLYGLAGAVATFYEKAPVLKAEPAVRASRLRLLDVVARTLRHGLDLLGIEVLDRM